MRSGKPIRASYALQSAASPTVRWKASPLPLGEDYRFLRAEPGKRPDSFSRGPVCQGQLPARCMPQFHDLIAKVHLSAAPGGQIDRPNWHLRRQAKGICRGGAVRDDSLPPLGPESLDCLLDRRCARTKPAGDGSEIDAAAGTDELPALGPGKTPAHAVRIGRAFTTTSPARSLPSWRPAASPEASLGLGRGQGAPRHAAIDDETRHSVMPDTLIRS